MNRKKELLRSLWVGLRVHGLGFKFKALGLGFGVKTLNPKPKTV